MSYTVTQLVSNSFYLSGIVSRGDEILSGEQLYEGLGLLNELLSMKTANQRLIPYFKEYNFSAEGGVNKYFIPHLVFEETLTFYINSVRFSTYSQTRKAFQGSSQAENITSLPYKWHMERRKGGADLYIYFSPDLDYPMTLWGKFSLEDVALNEDLLLIYDRYYIGYLRYALAEYICHEYNVIFSPQADKKLAEFENTLMDISPIDMSVTKRTMFPAQSSINYAIANISNGFI